MAATSIEFCTPQNIKYNIQDILIIVVMLNKSLHKDCQHYCAVNL